ncbi:glycoside hydrolase family 32 protein [Danxiaibacter flavus]|uniref:Glycoside hydrolase family 32 protein n=1 Tax=Danxiaibacter flavus TaxID=3049108 RepID=A0ABV3ZHK1_9BACT|nr:glycoside hydrolase family 32 protein [Chitinophagaceae bacterium DXS]
MKRILTSVLFSGVVTAACFGQDNSGSQRLENFSSFFTGEKKWLVLPVKNGAPKKNLELWVNGELTRWFDMEVADEKPDWFAYLDISDWKGQKMELRVDALSTASQAFTTIRQSDVDTNAAPLYKEKLRGQFHFSPKRGWTNDPNGMVYYNGEYHLFFQHNPYGRGWGNMHWGHAVSTDLLHWKEVGEALYPDKLGPMFSGSAVVDEKNTSGLGESGKPAMVMFFTGAKAWAQGLAWSNDGRTFHKLDRAVVTRINKDNRDPKVIWHEPSKKWVMVVWVERDHGQNSMQILTSPNLKDWTEASVVYGGKGDDRYLFECPEFFELPVDGNPAEKKWVLTAANSQYAIGTFDGTKFTPEVERLNGQLGRDFYASQTFNNEPKGRRIEIGWWRTHTDKDDMTFNQSQSIPMELKLERKAEGLRLTRTPVKELESLRVKTYPFSKQKLKEGGANPLSKIDIELAEIRVEFEPGTAKEVKFDVRGVPVVYNVSKQELTIDGVTSPAPLQNGKQRITIYADRTGLEVFASDGILFMPINKNIPAENRSLSLTASGGAANVSKLDVYELKSIWD